MQFTKEQQKHIKQSLWTMLILGVVLGVINTLAVMAYVQGWEF